MENYENPDYDGNRPKYHTGKPCYERGCQNKAGTAWSPYWCFPHNVVRMKRIDASLKAMERDVRARAAVIEADINACLVSPQFDGGSEHG